MIPDNELKKNCNYRVRIIDETHRHVNKKVTATFSGILFRGNKADNILYLSQIEVLEKLSDKVNSDYEVEGNNNISESEIKQLNEFINERTK